MKALFRRDPGTFVLAFAAWATVNGISLVLPGNAFQLNPIYGEVARLGIADTWWGLGMLADAALLAVTVGWGSAGLRAFSAIASASLWFSYGALLLGSAAYAGLLSGSGAYDLLGSLGLAVAGAQWVHTLAYARAPLAPAFPVKDEPWI
jgi:hypothetical protein